MREGPVGEGSKGCDGPKSHLEWDVCWGAHHTPLLPPKGRPGHQEQNSQLCTTPGREARRCLLFICKGSCQKLRQETAKENLTTRKENRAFQKSSRIPNHRNRGRGVGGNRQKRLQPRVGAAGGGKSVLRQGVCSGPTLKGRQSSWRTSRCSSSRGGDPNPITLKSMWGNERISTGKEKH